MRNRLRDPLARIGALIVLAATLACGGASEPDRPVKDLVNFTLPQSVQQAAPEMQAHLYQLAPYNSSRFEIKPEFVLLEGEDVAKGRPNPAVMRLNLLHMAYYRNGALAWSGSLLNGLHRGVKAISLNGYEIGFSSVYETAAFTFRDGETRFAAEFHRDRDWQAWLEDGDVRLYINHYVFPEALLRQKGAR